MIFRYFGLNSTERNLIEEIGFDDTPLQRTEGGTIIWGDPNEAFVGNIDGWQLFLGGYDSHSLELWGYGVYLEPLIRVARRHGLLAVRIADIESIYEYLDRGWPSIVVVPYGGRVQGILWEWYTPKGKPIEVMNRQHVVVVSGYDDDFVYVRDPAGKMTHYSRSDFEGAWANLKMAVAFGEP